MDVTIIVVPYDSGAYRARMGNGPERIVDSGLAERLRQNNHQVKVETIQLPDGFRTEVTTAFRLNSRISELSAKSTRGGALPIVLSGNCNCSLGLMSGIGSKSLAVLWYDAHGDYNTPETTRSGYFDGMALAIANGRCWSALAKTIPGFRPLPEKQSALLGARDLDAAEQQLLEQSEVAWLKPDDYEARFESTLDSLKKTCDRILVHVDLDVLDPAEAPANQYAAPNGLSVSQMFNSAKQIKQNFKVAGLCFASYDPSCDPDGRTAQAGIEIAQALVG